MKIQRMIVLPSGKRVTLRAYCAAWRKVKEAAPNRLVSDFEWFPVPAGEVKQRMLGAVHDRINKHLPGYRRGRKWDQDWQRAAVHCANEVNTPRRIVRWVPADLRDRLAHRIATD